MLKIRCHFIITTWFICHNKHYQEKFEDTKLATRSRKSKKDMAKIKRTNNGLQNITQKTKNLATRNPTKNRRWPRVL